MKKKEKKGFEDGYISFSPDQLKGLAESDSPNAKAYEWLYKATTTTAKIQKKTKKGKVVDIDDLYPVTADETEQMRVYLDKAEQSVADPNDSTFFTYLSELRSIVEWSSTRHSTFQWIIIAGVILTIFFISIAKGDSEDAVKSAEKDKATVAEWTQQDTTYLFEEMKGITKISGTDYSSANKYKYSKLARLGYKYNQGVKSEKDNRNYADTASTDKRKKEYLRRAESALKDQGEYQAEFEEINEMEYKKVLKMAKNDTKKELKSSKKHARSIFRLFAFFIIMIPLYIFSQRPYGYTITRLRLESKILGGIQKIFFGLAGGMAAGAFAMEFAPDTIVKWSDGSTTRENDSVAPIVAIKLTLYAIAICIFCGLSCLLIIYMTAQGLRRNYNWDPILAKMKSTATATASTVADKASEEITKYKQLEEQKKREAESNDSEE